MSTVHRRLEALEAAVPITAEGDRDTRARDALLAGLARLAHVFHLEAQRPPPPGVRPRPVDGRSPAEILVRRAMSEAAAAGAWGSPAYKTRFWGAAGRLLRERLAQREAAGS